jgi:hypothetical protein
MQNRPLRPFERGAHLHVLDWTHGTVRHRFQQAGAVQVKAASKAIVKGGHDSAPPRLPALEAAIHSELRGLYAVGHATVRSELDHQRQGRALPIGLSKASEPPGPYELAAMPERGDPHHLRVRAALIAQAVAHAIHQAIQRARLNGVTGTRALKQVGRAAGSAELAAQASHHAGGAINAGRRAGALTVIPGGAEPPDVPGAQIIGARYTSVLDKSTCGPCQEADTGELIPIGDPRWIPTPNPACLGGGRCRCIHVYQLSTETPPATALPPDDFPAEPRQPDRPAAVSHLPVAQVGVGGS